MWKKVVKYLLAMLFLFVVSSCSVSEKNSEAIIFVSGLGDNKLDRWQKMKSAMQKNAITFGGEVSPITIIRDMKTTGKVFFFAKMTDAQSSVNNQVDDLDQIIHKIKNELGEKVKVTLVGYSLGGVIARSYVATRKDPDIVKLVTIVSPHLGSNWAYFYDFKTQFNDYCSESIDTKRSLVSDIKNRVCGADFFTRIEDRLKLKIDSAALRDIRPYQVDDWDKFLLNLNQAKHPDIEYHSITASVEPVQSIQDLVVAIKEISEAIRSGEKLNKESARLMTFLRQAVSFPKVFIDSDVEGWADGGDGAVSHKSQQIANIDYFNQRKLSTEKPETYVQLEHEAVVLADHHNKIHNYTLRDEFHYGVLENEAVLELISDIVQN